MKFFTLISIILFTVLPLVCDAGEDFTIVRQSNGEAKVTRVIATPSGDWVLTLNYTYAKSGELRKIIWDYGTVSGYDSNTSEFYPTSCERLYEVSEKKELVLKSETISDSSGKVVKRTFFEPEVKHWMNIKDVPEKADKSAHLKK